MKKINGIKKKLDIRNISDKGSKGDFINSDYRLLPLSGLGLVAHIFGIFMSLVFWASVEASEGGLKDVRPPVSLPEFSWFFFGLGFLFLLMIVAGVLTWLKFKEVTSNIVEKEAWEIALEQLKALRERDLFGRGQVKEHFTELSLIARTYIEQRFDIRAPEMTTEEFLSHVKNSMSLAGSHKETLKSFLKLSDMVKFAKYGPSAEEAGQSFELIQRLIFETKSNHSNTGGPGEIQEEKL